MGLFETFFALYFYFIISHLLFVYCLLFSLLCFRCSLLLVSLIALSRLLFWLFLLSLFASSHRILFLLLLLSLLYVVFGLHLYLSSDCSPTSEAGAFYAFTYCFTYATCRICCNIRSRTTSCIILLLYILWSRILSVSPPLLFLS